jgi:uncharacterized protein (TIGR02118 family)
MTVKLVVLYTQPDDPAAFDAHYLSVHMPLVAALPGLQRAEAGQLTAALDGGGQTFYRLAELYFADQGAMNAALGSPEGQACAADFQKIAPTGSRMFVQVLDTP